jgi:tetratricopeptide (TPR) repeat protein
LNLGDYEGAKEGYSKAKEINQKFYGEDHPEYAKTIENLSNTLSDLGDY